ncbi:MAG: NHL repeat-containing protein [Deltaproteobacteria bacterium]|nr:NHL repeat-containing protein [Deltaproteobacteria bacterium]
MASDGAGWTVKYRRVLEISSTMDLPSDVAVDDQGRIYILDGTAGLVRVFNSHGGPLFTLGGAGVLHQPLGIDVNRAGDVLVADSGNHRLALFPGGADNPRFFTLPPPAGGKPADPTDVHFAPDNNSFIVVDNDNHRILAVNEQGKLLWAQGCMGRNPGEFRFPFLLDIDREGNIFVVEVINTRVQVLLPDGTFKQFIGDWGIELGQFFRPKGIAVNEAGEVFVSDSYLGVVQIFDHTGEFLGVVADEYGTLKQFTTPVGMAVSGNHLFVVEMFTNRLLVLEKER